MAHNLEIEAQKSEVEGAAGSILVARWSINTFKEAQTCRTHTEATRFD
jgi:hypothetical protein